MQLYETITEACWLLWNDAKEALNSFREKSALLYNTVNYDVLMYINIMYVYYV